MRKIQEEKLLRGAKRRTGAHCGLLLALAVAVVGTAAPHLLARGLPRPGAGSFDAIFVLTGGDGRIEDGYRAFREGKGRELYIIGTKEGIRLEQILPGRAAPPPAERERIHLEGWSENTLENAFSV